MASAETQKFISLPLVVNSSLAIARLWAATITGSSALLAEALRTLTDISSQALMVSGLARSKAEDRNPDLTFWTFVVAILLYAMSAGVALYEGIDRINRPRPLDEPLLAHGVLVASLLLQTLLAGLTARGVSHQPTSPIALALRIEANVGLICGVIALAGVAVTHLGAIPAADGVAAALVGLGMALTSALMSLETRARLASTTLRATPSAPIKETAQEVAMASSATSMPIPAAKTIEPPRPPGKRKHKGKRRRR